MDSGSSIPFLDLISPHVELERELTEVFRKALFTAGFVGGPMVEEFEHAFASFCQTDYAIAVNSGTDALRFALTACGIKPGDVVITVPHTFIATTEAISQAGAIPEFVDIDEATYNLSAEKLQRFVAEQCARNNDGQLISRRNQRPVRCVVPVHLYGQMADMDPILRICREHGLLLIEDACQAHGAKYFSREQDCWMVAGSVGHAAAFSFYPGKNLGACGEAGAATTKDEQVAAKIRMLRDHGQVKKYYHDMEGYNGRLDAIQAGILLVKLAHLEKWNEQRRVRAARYSQLLAGVEDIVLPHEPSWSRAVYHLYVIRTRSREGLMSYLKEKGIGTGIHYPIPLHLQKAYANLNYSAEDFPVATRVAEEILSLPMYPQLGKSQQMRVAEEIGAFRSATHKPAEYKGGLGTPIEATA
jgi:dTDP-4-amino-4,6-dideoxygalactose transaminase